MCGIGVILQKSTANQPTHHLNQLTRVLQRRGPDLVQNVQVHPQLTMVGAVLHLRGNTITPQPIADNASNWLLFNGEIYSCGNESDTLHVSNLFYKIATKSISPNSSNTTNTTNTTNTNTNRLQQTSFANQIITTLHSLQGPYSFAWWHAKTSTLWYGRDPLGRRSLLTTTTIGKGKGEGSPRTSGTSESWTLASTGYRRGSEMQWTPVSTMGIHCVKITTEQNENNGESILEHSSFPWLEQCHPRRALRERQGKSNINNKDSNSDNKNDSNNTHDTNDINDTDIRRRVKIPELLMNKQSTHSNDTSLRLQVALNAAVQARVTDIVNVDSVGTRKAATPNAPPTSTTSTTSTTKKATVGVLFSGGLDCTVIAALAHCHVPSEQPIDLINVCFDPKHASPDRQTSVLSFLDLCRLHPTRNWRLVAVDVTLEQVHACREHAQTLVIPRGCEYDTKDTQDTKDTNKVKPNNKDENTTKKTTNKSSNVTKKKSSNMDVNIGTALWFAARGQGRLIGIAEAKDLAETFQQNVLASTQHMNSKKKGKKEKKRKKKNYEKRNKKKQMKKMNKVIKQKSSTIEEETAAMVTNVAVVTNVADVMDAPDVTSNANAKQKDHIKKSNQTMSLSPSSPQASQASQVSLPQPLQPLQQLQQLQQYKSILHSSPCRVLLSGLGADEYMAGYGRHRIAYNKGGEVELQQELCLDAERLPDRNHGRDDRCISDHGKEVRYPYLDENVIELLGTESISNIVNFDLPRGQGEKFILRNVARNIGLQVCDTLPKRALQFGSRIVRVVEKGL